MDSACKACTIHHGTLQWMRRKTDSDPIPSSIASRGVLSVENHGQKYIYFTIYSQSPNYLLLKGLIEHATTTTRYYLITERNASIDQLHGRIRDSFNELIIRFLNKLLLVFFGLQQSFGKSSPIVNPLLWFAFLRKLKYGWMYTWC
jgi:hypothetical protein